MGVYFPEQNKFIIYEQRENDSVLTFYAEAHPNLCFSFLWQEYLLELEIQDKELDASQQIFDEFHSKEPLFQYVLGCYTRAQMKDVPDQFGIVRNEFEWNHKSKIEHIPCLDLNEMYSEMDESREDDSVQLDDSFYDEKSDDVFGENHEIVASIEYPKSKGVDCKQEHKETQTEEIRVEAVKSQEKDESEIRSHKMGNLNNQKIEKETQTSNEEIRTRNGCSRKYNHFKIHKNIRIKSITIEVENLDFSESVEEFISLSNDHRDKSQCGRREGEITLRRC